MEPYDSSHFNRDCAKPFLLKGNETGVLLLHGFTGCVSHMRPLGDALHSRGYTTMGINLPGHAATEGDMARYDWKDWLQAAKQAVLQLSKTCHTVVICGLSMGGVLALLVAEQMKVAACVPISAPMAVRNRLISLAGLFAPFYPRLSWHSQGDHHTGLDAAYDYGYSGFPTRSAADLNHLIRLARQNLFAINCPMLVVQSDADETIWEGSADEILSGISSESKQKLWLKGVPHVCTISKELPAIVDAMDDMLHRVTRQADGADTKQDKTLLKLKKELTKPPA